MSHLRHTDGNLSTVSTRKMIGYNLLFPTKMYFTNVKKIYGVLYLNILQQKLREQFNDLVVFH